MKACRTSDFWLIYSVLKEWQGDMDFLFENTTWIKPSVLVWQGFGDKKLQGWPLWKKDESFPDSSPPITGRRWTHHWIWCCLGKNVFMKEWKLLKEEERTWRRWGNRDRCRKPTGNSKRIPRSERQEVFHGRAYSPKSTEPGEDPCQSREKAKGHQKEQLYPDLQTLPPLHHWIPCLIESTEHNLQP